MSTNNENYFTKNDFHNICRTCTSKNNLAPLYENIGFVQMLQKCTMIQYDENDNLPKQICETCISDLCNAYKFTQKCKITDTALRKCFPNYDKTASFNKSDNSRLEKTENTDKTKSITEVKNNNSVENIVPKQNIECVYIVNNAHGELDYEESGNSEKIDDLQNETVFIKSEPADLDDDEEIEDDSSRFSNTEDDEDFVQSPETTKKDATTKTKQKNDRSNKCPVCQKYFASKQSLTIHKGMHEGPYQCKICNQLFSLSSALRRHFRIHTGERPYKCNICSKFFSRTDSLIKHKRIHTGDRPFSCEYCSKSFATSCLLDDHRKVHTGKRPFGCDICLKTYQTSSYLKRHKTVHNNKAIKLVM